MSNDLLRVEQVALAVDVSIQTINIWYRWKRQNPDSEYAKMLPDFIQNGERQTRYWNKADIWRLIEFKNSIPQGRNGILGSVTQKYVKKKETKDEQN